MIEKYYNKKDELGVLVSYRFGSGWSTWNNEGLKVFRRSII